MGCKSSTPASKPGNRPEKDTGADAHERPEDANLDKPVHQTPSRSALKALSLASEEQLKDKKVSDIATFAQQGNITMIYSIMKTFGIKDLVSLRGDTALVSQGFKVDEELLDTANWNPFLFAIAHK
jgi:hypothetical protein